MYSVLSQEKPLVTAEETLLIPVPIEVQVIDEQVTWFKHVETNDYRIDPEKISLFGSNNSPREFLLTFTLSAASIDAGYLFMDPALKFFQGGSKKAGFWAFPDQAETSVRVTLFNSLVTGDDRVEDTFSVLVQNKPKGIAFAHDPTIIWDPPHG
jgi:hypothetical protein